MLLEKSIESIHIGSTYEQYTENIYKTYILEKSIVKIKIDFGS